MIDLLQPAEPLESRVVGAATLNLPRRTDPPTVGIDPETDQQPRVPRRPARRAFHRFDGSIEALQVQLLDKGPDRSARMVLFNQVFYIHRPPGQLAAVHRLDARSRRFGSA